MSRDAVDTGGSKDREDRRVTVQIGEPLYPDTKLDDEEAVTDLRDRTRAAVVEMLGATSPAEAVAEPSLLTQLLNCAELDIMSRDSQRGQGL